MVPNRGPLPERSGLNRWAQLGRADYFGVYKDGVVMTLL